MSNLLKTYEFPTRVADYPVGSTMPSGLLTDGNAGMRTFRPVIDQSKCVKCLRCYAFCPDAAISKATGEMEVDYTFCKGCGVCAYECKVKAITMVKEEHE